ncbi:MAG: non-ribosomal peptide synthetase [Pyrinomonadaceae bacterium]
MDDLDDKRDNLPQEKNSLPEMLLKEVDRGSTATQNILRRQASPHSPLSFAQQRLWFLDQLEPNSDLHNIQKVLRLKGSLDLPALERSLTEIVRRHEALRTTFTAYAGQPSQIVSENPAFGVSFVDLSTEAESESENRAMQLAAEEARRPFNLAKDVMLRAAVFRLSAEEHLLVLVLHHISSDGWSLEILFRELSALYEGFVSNAPCVLSPLPIQYADFAVWQREWLQGATLENQSAYWMERLADAPALSELPTDRPRPSVQTYRGARHTMMLTKRLHESLKILSRREGATLFMTLLAAFQTLIARYTNQTDVIVGAPIAGRNRVETEHLIGFFVNTLALRTDLAGDPTFRELLGRVKETALGAYTHQDLPFEKLIEKLQPERHSNRPPLFQNMLGFQNTPPSAPKLYGLEVTLVVLSGETAKFDLSLFVFEEQGGMRCVAEYNTDLFDSATIRRLLNHFEVLLEGIIIAPERRLSELPLLTSGERRQLLVEWNATKVEYPKDKCIHELFEAQSERVPERVAVMSDGEDVSYRELNSRANQLAHHLRRIGIATESLVGILVERSAEMVVALLAVLKAGGAYVPLDPSYPVERLRFMLADAGMKVLLTEEKLREKLPEHEAIVIYLDSERQEIERQSTSTLARQATSDNLAYVIYTSGSSGTPKGVQVTHGALLNFLHSMHEEPGLNDEDTLLAVTTLSFDIAGLEIYLPLIVGARLVLVGREVAADGERLMRMAEQATVMQATPATWHLLLEAGWRGKKHLKALCGGETLTRDLADELLLKCGTLWNLYGPTETTIWSTRHRVQPGDGTVPIGRPIANTQVYILDTHLNPVPVGVAGELYIGGDGLARGYLNRPELTQERFIPHPFTRDAEAVLYKTGDRARWLPDSTIEFLGRVDNQIKLRGYRIEPGEIEATLTKHDAVRAALVFVEENSSGDKTLVAKVVAQEGRTLGVDELRSFLHARLPAYMIPSSFVLHNALPLTPNGKVDRQKLAMLEPQTFTHSTTYVAPRDAIEFRLVNIWEKVLGKNPVGVRDNFFELGGHSLLAMHLFAQLEREFKLRLPLAVLFQEGTIEHLARVIGERETTALWSSLVPIQPTGAKPPFYCVHGIGGNVLNYLRLARNLGEDQPFYGLQSQGLDGRQAPLLSIEEMAACYVTEIRKLQPEGPYFIGGASFGGVIAFEMARQLHNENQEIGIVALLDTFPLGHAKAFPKSAASDSTTNRTLSKTKTHLLNLRRMGWKEGVVYTKSKARTARRRLISKMWRTIVKVYDLLGHPLPRAFRQVKEANFLAAKLYVPKPYPGKVTLFQAQETPIILSRKRGLWWNDLASGGVETYDVPGGHNSMLKEPHVEVLAKVLKSCLDPPRTSSCQVNAER